MSLTWTAKDTAAAGESAKILAHQLRHLKETPEQAERMENSEYLGWIAFETSYCLCLEQRPLPAAGRRGTNNRTILIVLLELWCHTGFQIDYNFLLYKFAVASSRQKPQSADALCKARALSPAAAGASPSPASATAPDGAAPGARQALCASNPGTSTQGTAVEVYDYLINNPDRATEIAIIATDLQDASVQRLDAAPPP
jgi:hypothetical protein